jgi:hypothetical protein
MTSHIADEALLETTEMASEEVMEALSSHM